MAQAESPAPTQAQTQNELARANINRTNEKKTIWTQLQSAVCSVWVRVCVWAPHKRLRMLFEMELQFTQPSICCVLGTRELQTLNDDKRSRPIWSSCVSLTKSARNGFWWELFFDCQQIKTKPPIVNCSHSIDSAAANTHTTVAHRS